MRNRDDEDDDERPHRPRYIRCADGFCGAEDCERCRPNNFRGGIYLGDEDADDKEE